MFPILYSVNGTYQNMNSAYNSLFYVFPTVQENYYMLPCNNSIQNNVPQNDRIILERALYNISAQNNEELPDQKRQEVSITIDKSKNRKRKRTLDKQVESAKKNSESNIINQIYSFLSNMQLSKKLIERVIRSIKGDSDQIEKMCSIFYKIVRLLIFKKGKKYVNKDTIMKYFSAQFFEAQIPNIVERLEQVGLIIQNLCLIFRITTYYFIKNYCVSSIMTSKRISYNSKYQHLKRRRILIQFLQKPKEK